jgi:EAL domain-containing protein (putative c-di-GMP-specific phosphodiesterase class I)
LNRNSNLRLALEREEFSPVFQPQMEIKHGRSLGLKR